VRSAKTSAISFGSSKQFLSTAILISSLVSRTSAIAVVNSGVILSQLFRGAAKILKEAAVIDVFEIVES